MIQSMKFFTTWGTERFLNKNNIKIIAITESLCGYTVFYEEILKSKLKQGGVKNGAKY